MKCDGVRQFMATAGPGTPADPTAFTIEALCGLVETGDSPSVLTQPASSTWTPPYVCWRLGFYSTTARPEFQVTVDGDPSPTTARGADPVPLRAWVHLAGTFDGKAVRLFVDGELVAEEWREGRIVHGSEPLVLGARSGTDVGGFLPGSIHEFRVWGTARSAADIAFWAPRTLAPTEGGGVVKLYRLGEGISADSFERALHSPFGGEGAAFAEFYVRYLVAFDRLARDRLSRDVVHFYAEDTARVLVVHTSNGCLAVGGPGSRLVGAVGGDQSATSSAPVLSCDWPRVDIEEAVALLTCNTLKLVKADGSVGPDVPREAEWVLHEGLAGKKRQLPKVYLEATQEATAYRFDRQARVFCPITTLPSGDRVRAFDWTFLDIWPGKPDWDVLLIGRSELVATWDVVSLADAPLSTSDLVVTPADGPLSALEAVIRQFVTLIDDPNVREVEDILPFLADRRHWVILDPTAEKVWSEKRLGNKYRADYVVRRAGNEYIVIEIESPKKGLYTNSGDPRKEFTHAEQQVRDYCDYVDRNTDVVRREEGLPEIWRPKGLVVIGRRGDLSEVSARALAARNAENLRFCTLTFDDLIDRARALLARLPVGVAQAAGPATE